MRLSPPSTRVPVTAEGFRALARSSPWLWSTLTFEWTVDDGRGTAHRMDCQVRRPDYARAVSDTGEVTEAHEALGRGWVAWSLGGQGEELAAPRFRWAADTTPLLDGHGLVARQTNEFAVQRDAPMIQSYLFVALLDPIELADGQPSEGADTELLPDAVQLTRLHEGERLGRRTWWADAVPEQTYNPRCSCCALLPGEVSERLLAEESGGRLPLPASSSARRFRVGLDVQTGVCVSVTALDGPEVGAGFEVVIVAVDEPIPA